MEITISQAERLLTLSILEAIRNPLPYGDTASDYFDFFMRILRDEIHLHTAETFIDIKDILEDNTEAAIEKYLDQLLAEGLILKDSEDENRFIISPDGISYIEALSNHTPETPRDYISPDDVTISEGETLPSISDYQIAK